MMVSEWRAMRNYCMTLCVYKNVGVEYLNKSFTCARLDNDIGYVVLRALNYKRFNIIAKCARNRKKRIDGSD